MLDNVGLDKVLTYGGGIVALVALIAVMRWRRKVDPELRTTEDGRLSWRIAIGFLLLGPVIAFAAWIGSHLD